MAAPIVPEASNDDIAPSLQVTMVVVGGKPRLYIEMVLPPPVLRYMATNLQGRAAVAQALGEDVRREIWRFLRQCDKEAGHHGA